MFIKKDVYYRQDLIDFYERSRFTMPFMVYRAMKYWPLFDWIASYGHIVSNLLIVYTAIYLSNSFYNCFNILCVSMFYLLSAQIVHNQSHKNFDRAGLQTQCDVKMAGLVTKRYKNESFYTFLDVRMKIWNIQFVVLTIVVIASFPMVLLDTVRQKLIDDDAVKNADIVAVIDRVSFWAFMTGLYHYKHVVLVLFAMIYERQCINWLRNRYGCTHYKLQKFIELDIRREAIRDRTNWACPQSCKYDIENYRKHYFANDFDIIKKRITDNISEAKGDVKDEYGREPLGDFVPIKVGMRLAAAIKFSLYLDLREPSIVFDYETNQILAKWS